MKGQPKPGDRVHLAPRDRGFVSGRQLGGEATVVRVIDDAVLMLCMKRKGNIRFAKREDVTLHWRKT
jgi:hypothetical protein